LLAASPRSLFFKKVGGASRDQGSEISYRSHPSDKSKGAPRVGHPARHRRELCFQKMRRIPRLAPWGYHMTPAEEGWALYAVR